jgi:hypothetical protein
MAFNRHSKDVSVGIVVSVMLKQTSVYFCLECVRSFSLARRLDLLFNFLVVCSVAEFEPYILLEAA